MMTHGEPRFELAHGVQRNAYHDDDRRTAQRYIDVGDARIEDREVSCPSRQQNYCVIVSNMFDADAGIG